jgi:non-ribosomal peptide synthetase component F
LTKLRYPLIRYQDEGLNALAGRHFEETTNRLVGHLRKRRRRARYHHEELTYQALNQRANQLANHLRRMGVEPETVVGICAERSAERVVGILGVLKAGGACFSLDPQVPSKQLLLMLEDSAIAVLLTQEALLERLPRCDVPVICLDRDWATVGEEDTADLAGQTTPENAACVIYTTDSDGKPKRVRITHRELCSLVMAQTRGSALRPEDRVLQQALRSFDPSLLEVFATLLRGATLCLVLLGGLFVLGFPIGLSAGPSLGSGQGPGRRSNDGLALNRAAPGQAPSPMSRQEQGRRQSHAG